MGISMSDLNKEGVFEIDRAKDRILNDPFKTPERKKLELEELGITKPKKEADKPQAKNCRTDGSSAGNSAGR